MPLLLNIGHSFIKRLLELLEVALSTFWRAAAVLRLGVVMNVEGTAACSTAVQVARLLTDTVYHTLGLVVVTSQVTLLIGVTDMLCLCFFGGTLVRRRLVVPLVVRNTLLRRVAALDSRPFVTTAVRGGDCMLNFRWVDNRSGLSDRKAHWRCCKSLKRHA